MKTLSIRVVLVCLVACGCVSSPRSFDDLAEGTSAPAQAAAAKSGGSDLGALIPRPAVGDQSARLPVYLQTTGYRPRLSEHDLQRLSLSQESARQKSWVEGGFDTVSIVTSGALAIGLGAVLATGDVDDIEHVGDAFQLILPAMAYGSTIVASDWTGVVQFTKSIGLNTLFVSLMKEAAGKWRPNSEETGFGSSESFPSGHASAAWISADFINRRYGWRFGVPSYIMATYTGYSRIQANKHHTDDVLAGISFATFFNRIFVTPIGDAFELSPTVLDGGPGLRLELVGMTGKPRSTKQVEPVSDDPRFRYQLEFGGVWQDTNTVQSPGSGTPVDFTDNAGVANPTTSAAGVFSYYPAKRHEVSLGWWPFEARDLTAPISQPIRFGGSVYPAGTELNTLYYLSDVTARYRYDLLDADSSWKVKVGGGASLQFTEAEIQHAVTRVITTADDFTALPYVHLHLGYAFAKHWKLFTEVDGMSLSGDEYLNALAELNYRLNRNWDFGLGYRYYARQATSSDFNNDLVASMGLFSIGYSF